jgi:hypothetical protein
LLQKNLLLSISTYIYSFQSGEHPHTELLKAGPEQPILSRLRSEHCECFRFHTFLHLAARLFAANGMPGQPMAAVLYAEW